MKDAEKFEKEPEYSKKNLTKIQKAHLVLTVLAAKKLARMDEGNKLTPNSNQKPES